MLFSLGLPSLLVTGVFGLRAVLCDMSPLATALVTGVLGSMQSPLTCLRWPLPW